MFKKTSLIFLLGLLLHSCGGEGEPTLLVDAEPKANEIADGAIDNPDISNNVDAEIREVMNLAKITQEDLQELGLNGEDVIEFFNEDTKANNDRDYYKFSWITGECHNNDNEIGKNEGPQSCGDLSGQNIDAKEINKKKLYHLDLEGTFIAKGKVNLGRIAYEEYKYDDQTVFEGKKNVFKTLSKKHQQNFKRQGKNVSSQLKKIKNLQRKVASLMERYEKTTKEKNKERILKSIVKIKDSIRKRNKLSLIAASKRNRHKNFAISTEEMISE